MEVKDSNSDWVEYGENDISVKIVIVDRKSLEFLPIKVVNLDKDSTFLDFQVFFKWIVNISFNLDFFAKQFRHFDIKSIYLQS